MNSQVRVALTIPLFRVTETGVADDLAVDRLLLSERERAKRLREHRDGVHAHSRFASPRTKHRPFRPNHVANVEQLETRKRILAEAVATKVELDAATHVGDVREDRLALATPRDDTARHAHHRSVTAVA